MFSRNSAQLTLSLERLIYKIANTPLAKGWLTVVKTSTSELGLPVIPQRRNHIEQRKRTHIINEKATIFVV